MSARIGVLGAGQAGSRQAHGFALHPDASVVGVADVDAGRAETIAARYGARAVPDHASLLALDLDVLVVATPHAMHVEPALAAAGRGVHVMMEKPIATTLADARLILDACAAADVRLAVSFVHRFREESLRAKGWLQAAGRPLLARETINGQVTPSHPSWLSDRRLAGGGVLLYTAIHGVDRLRWLVGSEVREVAAGACAFEAGAEVERGVAALVHFENGCSATLSACAPRFRAEPTVWETEVFTDRTMVRIRTRASAERSGDDAQERYDAAADPATSDPHYNFARQADAMLRAVAAGQSPPADGADGLRALEVCLAIYRSAELGRPVGIDEITSGAVRGAKGAVP